MTLHQEGDRAEGHKQTSNHSVTGLSEDRTLKQRNIWFGGPDPPDKNPQAEKNSV